MGVLWLKVYLETGVEDGKEDASKTNKKSHSSQMYIIYLNKTMCMQITKKLPTKCRVELLLHCWVKKSQNVLCNSYIKNNLKSPVPVCSLTNIVIKIKNRTYRTGFLFEGVWDQQTWEDLHLLLYIQHWLFKFSY